MVRIDNILEGVLDSPRWLREQSELLNKQLRGYAQTLSKQSEGAEESFRENEGAEIGASVGRFLSRPLNLILAMAGIIFFLVLLKRL